MQTFLPYPSFFLSSLVLDDKRLRKQIVETKQILMVLTGDTLSWKNPRAWSNHPAVLQWKGYECALAEYGQVFCIETVRRGFSTSLYNYFSNIYDHMKLHTRLLQHDPPWLGNEAFHLSHQSNLVRKDPEHYGPLFPSVPNDLPYFWPSKEGY